MNERWYHEDISRPMAEKLLAKAAQDGSFLVRQSESIGGAFALCVLHEKAIYTYRIFINEDNLLSIQASAGIKSKNFEKMPDLIEYYKQENMGLVTHLRYPVERVEEVESPEMEAATQQGQFTVANKPISPHIVGLWEETRAFAVNPHGRGENLKTPQGQHPRSRSNPGLWRCEAVALPTVPPCLPLNYGAADVAESPTQTRSDVSQSLINKILAQRLEGVDSAALTLIPAGFHEALHDYVQQGVLKDAEHVNGTSTDLWQLRLLLSVLTKDLNSELIQIMSPLEASQKLLDNQPLPGGSMQSQITPEANIKKLISTAAELNRMLVSMENQVKDYEPETPDTDVEEQHLQISPVTFEVKSESFGILLKLHLKVDVEHGKLIIKKSKEGPEDKFYSHNKILQLIKSQKFHNKLVIVIDSEIKKTQRKEYVFTDSKKREGFCQLLQLMKNKHSDFPEPDMINIFIGTWNMGNASPPADIRSWFQCRGQGKTRDDTAADIPHDIYIIGTQEDTQGEKEWVELLKSTLKDITYIKFKHIATQTLWNIRIVILAKPEHENRISHISTSSVKTGIANALGNKGAVGVSFMFNGTSFGFINSHLTSGGGKKLRRNQNYINILRFVNLGDKNLSPFDITNRFTHLFWLGDLNYRVELPAQEAENIVEKIKQQQYQELLAKDQLTIEKNDKKIFLQFQEEEITFPPTYRYERDSRDTYNYIKQKATGLKYNLPSWCDRVLWKSYPNVHVMCQSYGCTTDIVTSDHSPVFATFEVGVSTQFVSKTDPNNADSAATINFVNCEATLKTKSKTKFFIEFHSSCLENPVKSAEGENQESRDENLTVIWNTLPELMPIISDPEYLLDQHILICVKSTDSYESYGEGCIALQASSNEIMFNIPLEHRGEETGKFSGAYKLTISEGKQREKTYDFIQLEKDEMTSVKQSKTNTYSESQKTGERSARLATRTSSNIVAEEAAAKARDRVPLPCLPDITSKDDAKPSSSIPENSRNKNSPKCQKRSETPPCEQRSMVMVSNPLYETFEQRQNTGLKKEPGSPWGLRKETPANVEKTSVPFQPSANKLTKPSWQVLPQAPPIRNRSYTVSAMKSSAQEKPRSKPAAAVVDPSKTGANLPGTRPPLPNRPPLPAKSQKVLEQQNTLKDYRESTELTTQAKQRSNQGVGQQASVS
ncbi:phosphatidylinositol 3,4,5-trisphosphate 5-phosphatase 1 isoform X2 [Pristis pectinata]|uniref:phosphatidylinositol 3,4,5-trisphosphate 5-phosphatase 1 isoform X2 n=1 Tax=Pristis pectinata TaxID=685728 RepID=UPI00223E74DF|nr:phosphatidylinositol 3,4,5-trisphosphate 5-phosphatase 1 isoform X2 [Pristis pectinata]